MLTVIVCHNATTDREHVGSWSWACDLSADRIEEVPLAELRQVHALIEAHGIEGVRIRNEERRIVWPPPAGEPYVALERGGGER